MSSNVSSDVPDVHLEERRAWTGRSESHSDQVTVAPVAAMSAMLDRDDGG